MRMKLMALSGVAALSALALGVGIQSSAAQMVTPAGAFTSGVVSANGAIRVPKKFRI